MLGYKMNKVSTIRIAVIVFLILTIVVCIKYSGMSLDNLLPGTSTTGVLFQQVCPERVVNTKICQVEVIEKRNDFAMLRLHYHYVKGSEASARGSVKANMGSHDNMVGTQGGFTLVEGSHTIDIPFGMYRSASFTKSEPYISDYVIIRAQGLSADKKHYTKPAIFDLSIEREYTWYINGDKRSW